MASAFGFKSMEVSQLVISSTDEIFVYATSEPHSNYHRFRVSPQGEVWGHSQGSWLQLTSQTASEIKQLVDEQFHQVPVYFEGLPA